MQFSSQTLATIQTLLESTEGVQKIVFDRCELDDDQWPKIKWQPRYTQIAFQETKITQSLVESLSEVPSLTQLTLQQCELENQSLDPLKKLKKILVLQLIGMTIDSQTFKSIRELRTLSSLRLSAVKFEKEDYDGLVASRPRLEIQFTAKAFLGVRGPINVGVDTPGCEISDVIAGSGAEEAGLQIGDVIEEVNGSEVARFEELRVHIAQKLPGEKLKLKLRRGKESLMIDVTLKDISTAPN